MLGAIVAPTDATAVAAVARSLPRRPLTMLRAESLVNDGTALVLFTVAVGVASGAEPFRAVDALGEFALSYLGGIAVGLVVAWLAIAVRRVARDALLESVVSVLTPFVAFLIAEEVHASGVLAVVVCGLALARVGPRSIGARTRVQAHAFWRITTFLLNAALFLLVGLELPAAVAGYSSRTIGFGVAAALLVAAAVVLTRLAWLNVVPYVIRLLDRRASQRARRMSARQRLPLAWSGFRGAVSLAIALAVPLTTAEGAPFPDRDLLLVTTCGVILVTLVVQGLTLPSVIRLAATARTPPPTRRWRSRRRARSTARSRSCPGPRPSTGRPTTSSRGCARSTRAAGVAPGRWSSTTGGGPTRTSRRRCGWPCSRSGVGSWSRCATTASSTTRWYSASRPSSTTRSWA